jgi:glycosyltransferase involved in cell wall biosynthesis
MAAPTVSVIIVTCNHETFIEQAVNSAISQKTDFEFEILISEDYSSDATRRIVIELRDKWPDRIKLLLSDHNLATNEVTTRCLDIAQGKYIALLQGDDYWTTSRKLQKQVDFMEMHPEYVTTFHHAELVYEIGAKQEPLSLFQPKPISTLNDLLVEGCFIETATVMFKREALGEVPEWYRHRKIFADDWIMHVFLAQHGDIGYIEESMAVHRYHRAGIWSRLDDAERLEKMIEACMDLREYLGPLGKPLRGILAQHWKNLAIERVRQNRSEAAKDCAGKGLKEFPVGPGLVARLLLLRYAPAVWRILKGQVHASQ